jgi:hypothetical protein
MNESPATKVVIEKRSLRGSHNDDLQKVATVYLDTDEYRIYAPPKATGDVLGWIGNLSVREPDREGDVAELSVDGGRSMLMIKLMQDELEKMNHERSRSTGMTPDDLFCIAQICLNGHVLTSDGMVLGEREHCNKCGAVSIETCQHCGAFVRGQEKYSSDFELPLFCYAPGCGRPYPWMREKLETARELLDNDDKLSLEQRESLWGDLKYVMSDPKADLVPAKWTLIKIKLEKAGKAVREPLLDLTAKVIAEVAKP